MSLCFQDSSVIESQWINCMVESKKTRNNGTCPEYLLLFLPLFFYLYFSKVSGICDELLNCFKLWYLTHVSEMGRSFSCVLCLCRAKSDTVISSLLNWLQMNKAKLVNSFLWGEFNQFHVEGQMMTWWDPQKYSIFLLSSSVLSGEDHQVLSEVKQFAYLSNLD